MRNVEDDDLLLRQSGLDAGKLYVVIASNKDLFVAAEMYFSIEDECYKTDLSKLRAFTNKQEQLSLKDLGFSKTFPRQY
jgi:hypothetical protein